MVDRGTDSINSLLSYVIFNILPTLVDIAIACVYFTSKFGPYFGLIVFTTMILYIYFTIAVTEWRTKYRRGMNTRDNKLRQMVSQSIAAIDSFLLSTRCFLKMCSRHLLFYFFFADASAIKNCFKRQQTKP